MSAKLVHTFCPLTTHSSPSHTAVVLTFARSEPASGSLNSWHQNSSPVNAGRSQRRFRWSSDANAWTAAAAWCTPT